MATVKKSSERVGPVRSTEIAERATQTRDRLILAARSLFVSKGYFDTGTEEIVARAVVTRGALYHHFEDKKALFTAVFQSVEEDLLEQASRKPHSGDALERLLKGLLGFLDASLTPEVQRIVLIDGPAVLGWDTWRKFEAMYGLAAIGNLLQQAMTDGLIARQPVDVISHILLATIDEAALFVANAPNGKTAKIQAAQAVTTLVSGLRLR